MRCVVTGAAGFIGSHLCEALLRAGHVVVGLDALVPTYSSVIKQRNLLGFLSLPNCRFFRIELCKDRFGGLLTGAEVVFHLAARPGTARDWDAMDQDWASNVQMTRALLDAVRRSASRLRRFVFASSWSVYGPCPVADESAPARPACPYGVTKLAAENLCLGYAETHGIPAVILRYFPVYGSRQPPDRDCHRFIQGLLQDQPVVVHGDGHEASSYLHVTDCVQATLAAVEGPPGSIYNVGGGEVASTWDLLHKLEDLAGRPARVRHEPDVRGCRGPVLADTSRLRTQLGWEPRTTLDEGLALQWAWQAGEQKPTNELAPADRLRIHDA